MSRAQRILTASALLVIALFGLLVVATQIPITYSLPPAGDGAYATTHVTTFAPAVLGTVLAAVAVIALLGHLVTVIRRPVPLWWWIAADALIVVVVGAAVLVSMADHPAF